MLEGYEFKISVDKLTKSSSLQQALGFYLNLINIYHKESLTSEDEDIYLRIIEDLLIASTFEYSNRSLPSKTDNYIVSRKIKNYSICNKANVQVDLDWVETCQLSSNDLLPIPLIINNNKTFIFYLDLKTMHQAIQIANGFRPNRQNIELIAKFDELIGNIIKRTVDTESMKLIGNHKKTVFINKNRRRYSVEV